MHANCSLLGRLGHDPELRYLQSGEAVCNVSLAVDQFDREADPDWWRITLWGQQAEFAANYLGKGCRVLVEGRPGLDEWEGEDGVRHSRLALNARTVKAIDWAKSEEEGPADRTPSREAPARSRPKPETAQQKASARQKRYEGMASKHGYKA